MSSAAVGIGGSGCRKDPPPPPEIEGSVLGNDALRGHQLRGAAFPAPTGAPVRRTVVIAGGGVAGLSAAWRLARAGVDDIEVVELGPEVGGTARGGSNPVSAYPWGAHYLPVPNPESRATVRLCRELGLMGPDSPSPDSPSFDGRHLVFEPEDRLFYRGKWFEGLWLEAGSSQTDRDHRRQFDERMESFRKATGKDGRPAFAIPMALSSRDPAFTRLDQLTMAEWLNAQGWKSPRLRWHVDYSCRDDYGAPANVVSAWAGIHYFAGRRPYRTPETEGTRYFTWPEGNARLIRHLREQAPRITTGRLVYRAEPDGSALAADAGTAKTVRYQAEHVILATPNHVTAFVTRGRRPRFAVHAPWLVCNLTLRQRPQASQFPNAWNNVLYESPALGYIDASHQRFQRSEQTVWTWYRAFDVAERANLLARSWKQHKVTLLDDLRSAHPDIDRLTERVDVWRWGHGTVIPTPRLLFGEARETAGRSIERLHFAHTDLSGLPLFEEAQYRGVLAAERVLSSLGIRFESWV